MRRMQERRGVGGEGQPRSRARKQAASLRSLTVAARILTFPHKSASSRSVIFEPVPLQETAQGMEQAIKGLLLRLEDLLLFLPLRFDVCQELLHLCAALGKSPGQ